MKYINFIRKALPIILVSALIGLSSCKDFLEQPTDAVTTLDSVFANPDNAMLACYNAYNGAFNWNRGLKYVTSNNVNGYPPTGAAKSFGNGGNCMMMFFSDEATQEGMPTLNTCPQMVFGLWGPQEQREFASVAVMKSIRACNKYIENAPRVPLMTTPKWVWNEAFRDQVISEVRILRAFLHFETFRRYGGIPIMDKVASFEEKPGQLAITPSGKRESMKSVIDFIVSECDAAIPNLKEPEGFSNAETGRIHKGFALALKAKALLYAASPLYNEPGSSLPVSYGDDRDNLLCYGNTDINRWKFAADAYQTAIDWAESHGKVLLDDPTLGKVNSYILGTESPRSLSPKNDECIYYTSNHPNALNSYFYRAGNPIGVYAAGYGTVGSAGYQFIKENYRDVNGNPINIPDSGSFVQLKSILRSAEPRFHGSIFVPGDKFTTLDITPWYVTKGASDTALFKYRDLTGTVIDATSGSFVIPTEQLGFFYPSKWRHLGLNSSYYISWSEFRLSEFYLSYAEAMNEFDPTNVSILTYLNKVRVRGGIPEILSSDPRFGNKDLMRAEIQKERAVELYGDEHRFFDVRRWKIAEHCLNQTWYKIVLYLKTSTPYKNPSTGLTNDAALSYRFDKQSSHIFTPKMYFYPWYQGEVDKKVLIQNPGW